MDLMISDTEKLVSDDLCMALYRAKEKKGPDGEIQWKREHDVVNFRSFSRHDSSVVAECKKLEEEYIQKIEDLAKFKMIKEIWLDNEYQIIWDRNSFVLRRKRPQKKDAFKWWGYYGQWHLHYALGQYFDRKVRLSDVNSVADIKEAMENAWNNIKSVSDQFEDQGQPSRNAAVKKAI